ncbi:DUF6759 domain-containing protein [Riemerella columbipharyngis]|uniref:DUF6759 domain-containing protein n=1 Tax=Riemerella columbipharyngis TaxID=1071918 RepID=A0A1G7BMM6_9FLAO|nr:DUF6759 domain-containing protein [Riemerella columbipharyngis]SDE27920.1 hypothetical protein SAMN05421544_10639 [Riemerella columbipharyngis]
MKKIFFWRIMLCVLLFNCTAKNNSDIFKSNDVNEVKAYIRANPYSRDAYELRKKLPLLETMAWAKPNKGSAMKTRQIIIGDDYTQIEIVQNMISTEKFKELMEKFEANHNKRTVDLLNQLFNSDISNTKTIILVENKTKCNMVLNVVGKNKYEIPIPAKGENSIVIEKGEYRLISKLCGILYSSRKDIQKNLVVTLDILDEKKSEPEQPNTLNSSTETGETAVR